MTEDIFARAQLAIERRTSRQLPHASFLQVQCSMDIFVPPGWMTRTELVNLTGQALVKDEWLGAMPTTAELLRADLELRAMLMPDRRDAIRRARAGLEVRSPERVLSENLAELLAGEKAKEPRKTDMHDHVVAVLRTQLCSGIIPAAVKTPEGLIVDIPPPFWQGDRAIPAFDTEEATVYHGPEIQTATERVFKRADTGRVLFKRAEANAWLASLDARPTTTIAATRRATEWFRTEVRNGEKRCTRDEYCAEMVQRFKLSKRQAVLIWSSEAPKSWRQSGRLKRP